MEATPNETQTVGKQHSQTASKHLPTFASMRSIHVARIREDGGKELLVELLKQIHQLGWDKHIQRVTRMWNVGPFGHFTITFNTTKAKQIIKKIWNASGVSRTLMMCMHIFKDNEKHCVPRTKLV